jgi:hypothetical protein
MKTATITTAQLQALRACEDGIDDFRAVFGDVLTYTADDIPAIVEMHGAILGEHADWCGETLLARKEREAFRAIRATLRQAWEAYAANERPAREEYQAIERPALEAYLDECLRTFLELYLEDRQ